MVSTGFSRMLTPLTKAFKKDALAHCVGTMALDPGTYHVRLSGSQALNCQVERHQTAGAGCIDGHARSLEVKEPADTI